MTTAFSQEVIDEVKDRVDIVEIIGSYVRLKRSGRNYVGLCPFHKEKTPSFTVSPDKQMFYCFGCGAGGDVFAFLMKQDGLSFPEAVKTLAARVGIDLAGAGESPAARREREWKERLYQLGAIAASFYYRLLMRHPVAAPARLYLQRRGVKGETARLFELGYAPDTGTALVDYLRRQGFTPWEIDQAGLSASRPPRGTADRFRGRLMFPIKDSRGRVIGFGGRILSEGQPKYLNSPETALFHKGRHLYGLHLALPGIRRKGQAILVEGYMDMIAAWQHGIDNVVASLGTALTTEQARELKKYAREVIIAYDADTAGEAATLRGLDILAAAGLQVRVLQLPAGKDPDEFLAARGTAAFQELVKESQGLMEFRINKAVAEHDPTRPLGRKAIMAAVLPYLQQVKDAVEQEAYIRLLSRRTGISEAAILRALHQAPAGPGRTGGAIEKAGKKEGPSQGERAGNQGELFLLQAYLTSPRLAATIDGELGEDWGESPATRSLAAFVREKRREEPELAGPDLARVLTGRGVPEWDALIARLTLAGGLGPVQERAVKKAIILYKLLQLQKQEREIRIALARAESSGATGRVQELQEQIFHLQQTIKAIKSGRGE
ncbi:DNA primase [Neomoorella mulderi]|uniref:DNA primase n=1 Tax=Moorella mulderi DSM 14980 TaxID=1122241 RepID=A0A151ATD6_9FIRM|nr:DNA primase [Moorella mulderi]KYH30810.1 DNA primase [Moorella mulderi DSM 14980]